VEKKLRFKTKFTGSNRLRESQNRPQFSPKTVLVNRVEAVESENERFEMRVPVKGERLDRGQIGALFDRDLTKKT
jgi:hypothetical protein